MSAERQGAVLGNNTALAFLGEATGALGGSLLGGLSPALPLMLSVVLLAVAMATLAFRVR